MIGLRDLCVALLAGGISAGGAVVAMKPPAKPKAVVSRPPPAKTVAYRKPPVRERQTPVPPAILDCPLPASSALSAGPLNETMLPPPFGGASPFPAPGVPYPAGPWGGGGVILPAPPPDVSAIPEPAGWVMMLGGFGLMGVALRRSKKGQTDV